MKEYLFLFRSRLKSSNFIRLIFAWHILRIKKIFKIDFNSSKENYSIKIDVVIITISKDFEILNESIKSVQKNVLHSINHIYVVSKKGEQIEDFCKENGYLFIDEISILGYGSESIYYKVDGVDRSGWMFQQLLKLSGEKFVEMDNYLIVDSDTILINPHSFIKKGSFVFLQNEEWNEPYFRSFKKIFGYEAPTSLSYTSHMMIFNTHNLIAMKKELEKKHNLPWDKVYVNTSDNIEPSCISDYDTYANWVLYNFPKKVESHIFYNKSMSRKDFEVLERLENKYARKYNSLSFHSYIK